MAPWSSGRPYRRLGDGTGASGQVSFPWSTIHTNKFEAKIYHLTETLDKHDKDITQQKNNDTGDYVDPDMFGASAIAKYNPTPIFKRSPNFDESGNTYDDVTFGFGKHIPQHAIPVMVITYSVPPLTVSIAIRGFNATFLIAALTLGGEVTTWAPTTLVVVTQIHNHTDM